MAANLGDIVATTLRNRQKDLADNITKHNALLVRLEDKGNIADANGGRTIVEPLMYAENSNAKWYDGYDTFTINPDESIDAAEYNWKQLGGFATISGIEEIKNSGKYAAINLIEARIKVLQATLRNRAGAGLFADGTGSSGKEFGGLQLLVADNPAAAGTVGGIDQVAQAWWRNNFSGAAATDKTTIQGRMNLMYLACIRGTDFPDLWLADSIMYTYFEESLQQYQRFSTSKMAELGFAALKYKQADVIYDENTPTKHMYALCTDYIKLRCAPQRKFSVGKAREIQNADYMVTPVWLAGNLTCANRSLQGVIIAS